MMTSLAADTLAQVRQVAFVATGVLGVPCQYLRISRAWGRDRGQPLTTTPVGGSPCGFTDEARSDIKRPLARQWTAADSTQPGPFAAVPEGSRGRGDIRSDGDTQSATGVWLARSRLAATDASVGFQPVRPTQCESRSHTRQGRHSRRVASSPSPPLCRKGERRSREEAASALPATAKRHRGPDSFPPPPLDAPRAPPLYYTEGVHGFSRLRTRAHLPVLSPIVGSPLSPSWSARGSSPPSKTTPASARPPSPASPRIPPAGVVRSPPLPGSPPPNPPFLFTPVLQVSGGYVPQTGGPLKRKRSQERGDSPEFGEPCRKVWGSPWVSWRKGEPVLPPSPGALWSPSGSPEGLQSDSD
ncbi:Sodium:neurotransmitter symporter family protein [Besnoitia besnoiti]|uniref:Sodium:neurotransmitter symporter family protein n=1 Tax=Besnoitia besnoiti TaxID=94643 RepID=A0A2A9M4Q7_BESBE|nr:Sodium:neurotransmitter symporter family protein [Besnoitia besnoiti]PFH33468.1 Sodium:neurotransmitter symporter family protein [Besnoitia besnoiti]